MGSLVVRSGVTGATTPPTGASDGVSLRDIPEHILKDGISALIFSTQGSGIMTIGPVYGWLYLPQSPKWGRGLVLNGGLAIEETQADKVWYEQPLLYLDRASRFDFEVAAVGGGGSPTFDLVLVWR